VIPGTTGVPAAFIGFCARFPDQCPAILGPARPIVLTEEIWKTLLKVNSTVNSSVRPLPDREHYGRSEYWTLSSDGYGDCEDYALTKRKDLIAAGLPLSALRMAVVVTPKRERHAVLLVETDKGEFVLDNLRSAILPWQVTGYRWVQRQNSLALLSWEAFLEGRGDEAAAARLMTAERNELCALAMPRASTVRR
jgi:predicted transglutaminase-like cysteine proteinase